MNNNDRFILQPSKKPGFWVATDKERGIVITFKEHEYNDTQHITLLGGNTFSSTEQAMAIPTALREIADWLRKEHYDTAMPPLKVQREHIGQTIRNIRLQRGMTQQDLADAAGIPQNKVSSIEAGKYSVGIDILDKIANALGVAIEINE